MTIPPTPMPPTPQRSGMPKWLIIVLVIFLIIVLGCCGGVVTCTYFARQAASSASEKLQKMAEEAERRATESSSRGGGGGGSVETPETPAEIPANFPSDIPLHKLMTPSYAVSTPAQNSATVTFATKESQSVISDYYKTEMPKRGWTSTGTYDAGKIRSATFTNGDRVVSLVIMSGDNGCNVTITHQTK